MLYIYIIIYILLFMAMFHIQKKEHLWIWKHKSLMEVLDSRAYESAAFLDILSSAFLG